MNIGTDKIKMSWHWIKKGGAPGRVLRVSYLIIFNICTYIFIFRFDGFEQGLNNFHVQAKSIGGSENLRRSPPNKKTKKASKDLVLESPKAFKDNKFGESADKFLFLGELHVS